MKSKIINVIMLILLLGAFVLPKISYSQLTVERVFPPKNAFNANLDSEIFIYFNEKVNSETITDETIKIHGDQSGFFDYHFQVMDEGQTVRLETDRPFKIGEKIAISITKEIQSNTGGTLVTPYVWYYTINSEIGDGTYEIVEDFSLGGIDHDPIISYPADFDNDGFPDLAVLCPTSNSICIMKNGYQEIHGGFFERNSFYINNGPSSISGADLDGNGNIDLIIGNFHGSSVSILWNVDGEFTADSINVGNHPSAVGTGDFDGDGDIDILAVLMGKDEVILVENNGGRNFSLHNPLATQSTPTSLAVGDFDLDGATDFAVSNVGSKSISLFLNNGEFLFSSFIVNAENISPIRLLADDVSNYSVSDSTTDRQLDLIALGIESGKVIVFRDMEEQGVFSTTNSYNWPLRISSGILTNIDSDPLGTPSREDGDFDLDLVLTDIFDHKIKIMKNSRGVFSYSPSLDLSTGQTPTSVVAADFNLDGGIDLAVTNLQDNSIKVFRNSYSGCNCYDTFGIDVISYLNFGQVFIGKDSTQFLKVINRSGKEITIQKSTSSSIFSAETITNTIPAGKELMVSVTFSPQDTINYYETLKIEMDSHLSTNACNIRLYGEGVSTTLVLEPDSLDFGIVPPGFTKILSVSAHNVGNTNLLLTNIEIKKEVFSSSIDYISTDLPLIIPPHKTSLINFTFSPEKKGTFKDTVSITTNNFNNPYTEIILLGRSYRNPPQITSPDSAVATEHQYFEYVATAIDSDGTTPSIRFDNYPNWLHPSDSLISGTPPEGAGNTTFRIIASDGFLEDTLTVSVRVIPVNDPPILLSIGDKTIYENNLLEFQISATDPENDVLEFSIEGLPEEASFIDHGSGTATFSWRPPFGAAGGSAKTYPLSVQVRESQGENPLNDFQEFTITVRRLLPDLQVHNMQVDRTDARLNQIRKFTAIIRNEIAPAFENIMVSFLINGRSVADTTIGEMEIDEESPVNFNYRFTELGTFKVEIKVDPDNVVPEINEQNNSENIFLDITRGSLHVKPNPFTPNNDGFNDQVTFDFYELGLRSSTLKIFTFEGKKVLEKQIDIGNRYFRWNGIDANGKQLRPGIFLYILEDVGQAIENGYIVLAR